jgi:general secretion pathway protein D
MSMKQQDHNNTIETSLVKQPSAQWRRVLYALIALTVVTSSLPAHVYAQNEDLDRLFDDEELEEPVGNFNQAPGQNGFPQAPGSNPTAGAPTSNVPPDTGSAPDFGSPRGAGGGKTYPVKAMKPVPVNGAASAPSLADAQIEDMTDANYPDLVEANFPNAEITDVIKAISQLTNKNFIIDPGVRGKISIIAPSKVTVAEAYKAFLAALAVNGFTVVPYGKFLKVKASRNAQRDSIETYTGKYAPTSDIYITRIIHLKHISAEEVNKRLRVLPSKDGEMTPYEPTNSLLITDYGANVERMVKIINELDRPGFEEQLNVIPIRYAKSKDLADLINQIINKETRSGGSSAPSFGANVPRFRSRGGTAAGGTPEELSLVAPDDRTNSLIVVGNRAGIEKVRDLVKKLDNKLDPAEAGGVFVYYVRFGEAEKIAQTIGGLAGGSSSTSTTSSPAGGAFGGAGSAFGGAGARAVSPLDRQNIFGGDVKINADKNTNSLVITASKQDYDTVRSLLAKLDIPRDQVFVETIIMEMNANKTRDWNPTFYYLDPSSKGVGRSGFSKGNLTSLLDPTKDKGAILGFGGGATFDFQIPGSSSTVKIPSLLAFISFLQQNVESNILSTPRIMALDNEEATIEVGDKVPVSQTTTSVGNNVVNDVKTENATIKLVLTPYIRPDSNVVRLKLNQSVKQVNPNAQVATGLSALATTISDRSIITNIVVNSGDTAVLGGLIRDEESIDETKIPILGDIPVLGWLFKSRALTKKKINLVVFITPRIIRNIEDSQNLLGDKANERIDWIKRNFDGRDPNGARMDSLPRTASREDERRVKKTNSNTPVNVHR